MGVALGLGGAAGVRKFVRACWIDPLREIDLALGTTAVAGRDSVFRNEIEGILVSWRNPG
jgi:hypothetical protein